MSQAEWYYEVMGEVIGPILPDKLKELAESGTVVPETNIRCGLDGEWTPAAAVRGLFKSQTPASVRRNSAPHRDVVLVTTESYHRDGFRTKRTLPMVSSRRVVGINFLQDAAIAVRDVLGGRSRTAEEAYEKMEREVMDDLRAKAHASKAQVVVNVEIKFGVITPTNGNLMFYATGHGTPLILEQSSQTTAGEIDSSHGQNSTRED